MRHILVQAEDLNGALFLSKWAGKLKLDFLARLNIEWSRTPVGT